MKAKLLLVLCVLGVLFIGAPSFAQITQSIDADPMIVTNALYIEHIGPGISFTGPVIVYSSDKPTDEELEHIFGDLALVVGWASYVKLDEFKLRDLIEDLEPFIDGISEGSLPLKRGTFRLRICTAGQASVDGNTAAGNVILRELHKEDAIDFFSFLAEVSTATGKESVAAEANRLKKIFSQKIKTYTLEELQ